MPEGPTIRNTADRLREALIGQKILDLTSRYKKAASEDWAGKIKGQEVVAVRSHGKNLFIELSNGYQIYSHMLMWGSWHIYTPGEEWTKAAKLARLVLYTPEKVAVLFNAPICEVISLEERLTHKTGQLGPDLLEAEQDFDPEEVWRRLQLPENRDQELGAAIMNQFILAGIGNILKSEILFQAGLNPLRLAKKLTRKEFKRFIEVSRDLMDKAYVTRGFKEIFLPPEIKAIGGKFGYVYRRTKSPCFICRTPIQMVRQGELSRTTYFCPTCQPFEGRGVLASRRKLLETG